MEGIDRKLYKNIRKQYQTQFFFFYKSVHKCESFKKKYFIILHLISSSSDNTIPLFLANEDNREAFLNKVHLVRRISSIQQFPALLILFFSFSFFHKNRPIKEKTVKVKKGRGRE